MLFLLFFIVTLKCIFVLQSTPTSAGQMDLSLQRTIQNLGDRLIIQMNCLQMALTDSINKLVLRSHQEIEDITEKLEKIK